MHLVKARLNRLVVSALSLSLAAGLAVAQNQPAPPGPAEPDSRQSVLVLERMDLDRILVAAKDQGLRKALAMLPARLRELPDEIPGGEQIPPEVVELLPRLLSGNVRMGVTYDGQNQKEGFGGAGIVLSFAQKDEQEAKAVTKAVQALIEQAPDAPELKPSTKIPGMVGAVTPIGVVRLGPRKTAAGNWAFEIHLGGVPSADDNLKELGNIAGAAGVTSFMKGRFDPAPLGPVLGLLQVAAGSNPQAAQFIQDLTERNIIGPEAAKWVFSMGHTADESVSTMTMMHVADGQPKDSLGIRALNEADFNLIPADAYFGTIAVT